MFKKIKLALNLASIILIFSQTLAFSMPYEFRKPAFSKTPQLNRVLNQGTLLLAWGFNPFMGGYRPYYGSNMGGYPMNYGYNNMMYNNYGNRYMYPMNSYGFGSMYGGYAQPAVNYRYNSW